MSECVLGGWEVRGEVAGIDFGTGAGVAERLTASSSQRHGASLFSGGQAGASVVRSCLLLLPARTDHVA